MRGFARAMTDPGAVPTLQTDLERVALGRGPTPVRRLASIGGKASVWLKDDGAYSRFGGNKARKLEWLLGDARRRGKRTIVTGGALGSNHALATALFARELGMHTVLVLAPQPRDEHVERQLRRMQNAGAEIHLASSTTRAFAVAASLLVRRASPPATLPYLILPGGSVPRGCVGYVEAGLELARQVRAGQLPEPSHIVVPLGSGGTMAGLLVGVRAAGLGSRVVGILVNDLIKVNERTVSRLARRTASFLRRHGAKLGDLDLRPATFEIHKRWLGPGYGHSTPESLEAIELLRSEGVVLEPVYTAKTVAALLELNERAAFGAGPVLYWHTYTAPRASRFEPT
jgi:D-cysteine desulfhydrase